MNRNSALGQRTRLLPLQLLVPANSPFLASHFLFLLVPFCRPGQVRRPLLSLDSTAPCPGHGPHRSEAKVARHCSLAHLCCLAGPCPYSGQLALPSLPHRDGPIADHLLVHLSSTWNGIQ